MREKLLLNEDQLIALSTRQRTKLFQALAHLGPSSVREVAHHLDLAPHSLYHHFKLLAESGLIEVTAERPSGARIEKVYSAVAKNIYFDPAKMSELHYRDGMSRSTRNVLKNVAGHFDKIVLSEDENVYRRYDDCMILQFNARLERSRIAEFVERLDALKEEFDQNRAERESCDDYLVTFAAIPEV